MKNKNDKIVIIIEDNRLTAVKNKQQQKQLKRKTKINLINKKII